MKKLIISISAAIILAAAPAHAIVTTYDNLVFVDHSVFADFVFDYQNGSPGTNSNTNSDFALHAPALAGSGIPPATSGVSLGGEVSRNGFASAFIILQFIDNALNGNGLTEADTDPLTAADLVIWEAGANDRPQQVVEDVVGPQTFAAVQPPSEPQSFDVAISTDANNWLDLGTFENPGGQSTLIDIDPVLQNNGVDADTLFKFVKVTDNGSSEYESNTPGIDVDAVAAKSSVPVAPEPATMALLGMGILGVGAARRKRVF